MENKNKLIAAVVVILLVGSAGLYFGGGKLMGSVRNDRNIPVVTVCPSVAETLYSQTGGTAKYSTYKDFFDSISSASQGSDRKGCTYKFYLYPDEGHRYWFTCSSRDVSTVLFGGDYGSMQFECKSDLGGGRKVNVYLGLPDVNSDAMATVRVTEVNGSAEYQVRAAKFQVQKGG